MNPERTERRLAAAAMVFRCLMWFPVWMLLISMQQASPGALLPSCGILLAAACVTAFWARFWKLRHRGMYPLRTALLIGLVLLPAAAGTVWLLMRLTGGFMTVLLPTAVTLLVLALTAHKEPDMLYTAPVYGAFLALTAAASLMMTFAGLPLPMTLILAVTGAESAGFFLLRNQFTLRRLVNRRSVVETDVPRDIKRLNLLLTGGVFALLLAIFLFRTPLLMLLRWMERAALIAVRAVLFAVNWLIGRFGGDAPEYAERESGMPRELISDAQTNNPLWLLLWLPVIPVVVFVWREFLSQLIASLRELLAGLFHRGGAQGEASAAPSAASELGYTDTETRTEREETVREKRRSWRREVRAWERLPDGEEKFFAGYALLLRAPAWGSEQPREADTVREICAQWQAKHGAGLDAVTADFQGMRYADLAFSASAADHISAALTEAAAKRAELG